MFSFIFLVNYKVALYPLIHNFLMCQQGTMFAHLGVFVNKLTVEIKIELIFYF